MLMKQLKYFIKIFVKNPTKQANVFFLQLDLQLNTLQLFCVALGSSLAMAAGARPASLQIITCDGESFNVEENLYSMSDVILQLLDCILYFMIFVINFVK